MICSVPLALSPLSPHPHATLTLPSAAPTVGRGGGEGPPAGADATLGAGVTAVPVSAARGVGWARGAGSGTAGELRDVREVLQRGEEEAVSKGEPKGCLSGSKEGMGLFAETLLWLIRNFCSARLPGPLLSFPW